MSRTDMATATLTDGPAVQLTFPWALPKAEEESTIVAERRPQSAARTRGRATRPSSAAAAIRVTIERHNTAPSVTAPSVTAPSVTAPSGAAQANVAAAVAVTSEPAASLQEALCDDRIGKPFRVGAVMFRLLKRYGITDEEIAEGIAAYTAKRNGALA